MNVHECPAIPEIFFRYQAVSLAANFIYRCSSRENISQLLGSMASILFCKYINGKLWEVILESK